MSFQKFFLQVVITSLLILSTGKTTHCQTPVPTQQKVWSLRDLLQQALNLSETVRIAEKEHLIARKDKDRAFSVLIPRLTAFGGYTRYRDAKSTFQLADWNYGVRFDQSFTLNGREITALGIAEDQIRKTRLDLANTREVYLQQVAAVWYSLLKALRRKQIAQAGVQRLTSHREAVQVQLQLENIPKTELYSTEANLSGAETEYIQAQNNVHIARATLARLVDLPRGYQLNIPDLPENDTVDLPLEDLCESALKNRDDLESLRIVQKISESNIRLAKGAFWPTLSLEGGYTALDASLDFFTPVGDFFFIGANVNFPIYEGGLRKAEVGQARIRARQTELRLKDYAKQISVEVETAYRNVKAAESAIAALGNKLKWARENYRAVTLQFQTGTKNSLDVIDANTLLTESEQELAESRYDHEISLLNLQRAQGDLLENMIATYNLKMAAQ